MATTVKFYSTTLAKYAAIAGSREAGALYFIEDAGKLFKGDTDVTSNVFIVDAYPTTPFADKIYVKKNEDADGKTTYEVFTYANGDSGLEKITLNPGYITTAADIKDSTKGDMVPTAAAIASYISDSVDTATDGVVHDAEWDAEKFQLTLPMNGVDTDLVINIPKDMFVQNGYYDPAYNFAAEGEDEDLQPAIVLEIKTADAKETKTVAIPASGLIDEYTGKTNAAATVTVNASNEIEVVLNLGDADDVAAGQITVVNDTKNGVVTSGKTIATTLNNTDDEIATSKAVMTKVEEIKDSLKLSDVEADEIVVTTADGGFAQSGKKVGGATLAENPSTTTVATEAAVAAAIESVEFTWDTL